MIRSRAGATALVLALATLTGCTGADEPAPDVSTAGATGSAVDGSTDVLATEEWAVHDGMVSVLVRNTGDRSLRRATALVTAVDERGVTVASSAAQAVRGDCCTVLDLPSGGTYGLYFDTTADPSSIAEIQVRYREVSWGTADAAAPEVEARTVELTGSPRGAVVVADVTPSTDTIGGAIGGATVQAVLTRSDGDLLAVVSGRWRCFAAGTTSRIRMELFHPVPAGTEVAGVTVLPVVAPNTADDFVDGAAPCDRDRAGAR